MEPTRVLVIDLPPTLCDIVMAAFEGDPAFRPVSRRSTGPDDVAISVDETRAGVVIVGSERPGLPVVFWRLLEDRPLVAVLAVTARGRESFLHIPLGQLSPRELVEAVRWAVSKMRDAE